MSTKCFPEITLGGKKQNWSFPSSMPSAALGGDCLEVRERAFQASAYPAVVGHFFKQR